MIKKIAPLNTAILLICGWIASPEVFLTANESVLDRPSKNNVELVDDRVRGFLVQAKLHQIHLEMAASEWNAMEAIDPRRGRTGIENLSKSDEEQRQVHRGRFPWAVGSVTIGEQVLKDIGVRYKGNASFNLMRGSLKRNLKIKLDWVKDDQSYNSVKTLNLNAGGLDPSKLRDALGYALFREAGVPAPRTTYAEVTLTVPGKYDKEHLGLYTIIEQVNKAFLKDRFQSDKGLLMKPEGVASVEYYGNEWKFYESLYRPEDEPLVSQSKRVIEFAKLVNESSDKQFQSKINSYLDIDTFLRFIAVNALIVNLDTLLAMPQNYYIYLHPKSEEFVFFPWDLDISFAGWPLGGTPEEQMDLSLMHPHSSDEHSLIDRLFSIEEVKARYARIIDELMASAFSEERLLKNVQRLEDTIQEAIERDAAAIASRNERGYPAPRGYQPPSLKAFIAARMVSIKSQLDGQSTGYVFSHARRGGRLGHRGEEGFGRGRLASHMLSQGDRDKDNMLSREELVSLLEGWFDTMDGGKRGELDKASFINSLPDAFYPSNDAGSRRLSRKTPERYVSEGLFSVADPDLDGLATKKSLIGSFEKWFDSLDKSSRGKLDEKSLVIGLRDFISMTLGQGQ